MMFTSCGSLCLAANDSQTVGPIIIDKRKGELELDAKRYEQIELKCHNTMYTASRILFHAGLSWKRITPINCPIMNNENCEQFIDHFATRMSKTKSIKLTDHLLSAAEPTSTKNTTNVKLGDEEILSNNNNNNHCDEDLNQRLSIIDITNENIVDDARKETDDNKQEPIIILEQSNDQMHNLLKKAKRHCSSSCSLPTTTTTTTTTTTAVDTNNNEKKKLKNKNIKSLKLKISGSVIVKRFHEMLAIRQHPSSSTITSSTTSTTSSTFDFCNNQLIRSPNYMVMISYVHSEGQLYALNLKKELEKIGLNVYLDLHEIRKGSDWQDSLNKAVLSCQAFVPLVTPSYGTTLWTGRELKLADLLAKQIIPINFGQKWPPPALAIQFATIQYVSWLTYDDGTSSSTKKMNARNRRQIIEMFKPIKSDNNKFIIKWPKWDKECVKNVAKQIKLSMMENAKQKQLEYSMKHCSSEFTVGTGSEMLPSPNECCSCCCSKNQDSVMNNNLHDSGYDDCSPAILDDDHDQLREMDYQQENELGSYENSSSSLEKKCFELIEKNGGPLWMIRDTREALDDSSGDESSSSTSSCCCISVSQTFEDKKFSKTSDVNASKAKEQTGIKRRKSLEGIVNDGDKESKQQQQQQQQVATTREKVVERLAEKKIINNNFHDIEERQKQDDGITSPLNANRKKTTTRRKISSSSSSSSLFSSRAVKVSKFFSKFKKSFAQNNNNNTNNNSENGKQSSESKQQRRA